MDLLSRYVQHLLEWNRKVNLISRRDVENVWKSHILHSLSPLFEFQLISHPVALDLGAGGGLPGIPLRILSPDMRITLLDSIQKKVMAVEDILQKLDLTGADAVWGRAEDMQKSSRYKGKFHYVVARAVAPLEDLVRWSVGFLKPQMSRPEFKDPTRRKVEPPALIALKGGDVEKETTKTKRISGVKSVDVISLTFRGSEQLLENDKKIIVVQF